MYHGPLEMSRLIECVTAFGPDGALQVCIMVCPKFSQKFIKLSACIHRIQPSIIRKNTKPAPPLLTPKSWKKWIS